MGVDPLRSPPCPLGGKEGKSPTSSGQTLLYLGKFQIFRHPTESKMCSSALFPLDYPLRKHPYQLGGHEFNSWSWQNEKIKFSQKISYFPTWYRDVISLFTSGPYFVTWLSTPSEVPLAPSPQKRVFPPNFQLLIAQKFLNFFEIVPGGKLFPWYLKINL